MDQRSDIMADLTASQREAMRHLLDGDDVFLTGKAGTGKSYIMNLFIDQCKRSGLETVAMAPTGTAALNLIDGSTLHRTLRIRNGVLDPADDRRSQLRSSVLKEADVVILDEVSMCRCDLFDRFMAKVRTARKQGGAKQVVVVGDFYQLPPVATKDDAQTLSEFYPNAPDWFAFSGIEWPRAKFAFCELTEVVRQPDPQFAYELNLAREGDPSCIPYFNDRAVRSIEQVPRDVLWLTATNRLAESINTDRAAELIAAGRRSGVYKAESTGDVKPSDKSAPEALRLVEGARVMLVTNDSENFLGNGSMGTVVRLGRDFARVRFDGRDKDVDVYEKTWKIKKATVTSEALADGEKKRKIEYETVGTYTQLPLKLAFAITIHKAQGKTFDRCAVHTEVFEAGMLYVGLSRCSKIGGLYVYPTISRRRLYANARVKALYSGRLFPSVDADTQTEASLFVQPKLQSSLMLPEEDTNGNIPPKKSFEDDQFASRQDVSGFENPAPSSPISSSEEDDMVSLQVPASIADRVQGYIDALLAQEPKN